MNRRTLVEWIGEAAGLLLPDVGEIHERSPTIVVLGFLRPARKGVADVVLSVFDRHGCRITSWILEVQLSLDWSKRWTWPMLETALAAETHSEARVVVFSPDPLERAAIRRHLLPKMQPRPLLIEPDQIPMIDDPAEAREEALASHRNMLRRLIIDILEARGTEITNQLRTQIEQCDDVDQLARWCSKAATWTGPAEASFVGPER